MAETYKEYGVVSDELPMHFDLFTITWNALTIFILNLAAIHLPCNQRSTNSQQWRRCDMYKIAQHLAWLSLWRRKVTFYNGHHDDRAEFSWSAWHSRTL